ncbi:hypothetical protein MMC10_010570 [Thelotrema lepadinum]|nr:hypothetical protein [Thelotrema lepadinum]
MVIISSEKGEVEDDPPEGSLIKDLQDTSHEESSLAHVGTKVGHGTNQSYLEVPLRSTFNASNSDLTPHIETSVEQQQAPYSRSSSPAPPKTWRSKASNAWQENKGVVLMILAQFFGSAMAAITRLLETDAADRAPMDPFQILFARQSVTVLFSLLYMWWAKVPEAPLGPRAIRPILALRGFGGFFGVFGLYYSLIYLPLADAIVMTFLAPMLAAWICSFIIKTPFTRSQQIAGVISLLGVVLITRPFSLLYSLTSSDPTDTSTTNSTLTPTPTINSTLVSIVNTALNATSTTKTTSHFEIPPATPIQRLIAVFMSLLGVLGASTAYVTLSWIGKRAHPLVSVTYFSAWCTFISIIALAFVPAVPFRLPATTREWLLLASLGVSGFVMQFLLTSSLAHRRSNRVLNIVYVQMLFALGFDKLLFDESPGLLSVLGSGLILGSVIWVAVKKYSSGKKGKGVEGAEMDEERSMTTEGGVAEEEEGLVDNIDGREERGDGEDGEERENSVEMQQIRR